MLLKILKLKITVRKSIEQYIDMRHVNTKKLT